MAASFLCDMDDTLTYCSKYYIDAHEAGAKLISEFAGVTPEHARALITEIDLEAARKRRNFNKDRFGDSFVHALWEAHTQTRKRGSITPAQEDVVRAAANAVYTAEYGLKEGAVDLLKQVRRVGLQAILVTKGDEEVQNYKIEKNGLKPYFNAIEIVKNKSFDTWQAIVERHNVTARYSFVIGDSLKDDIAPAKRLGLRTIHVANEDCWAYNSHDVEPDHTVSSLLDVAAKVPILRRYAEAYA